MKHKQPQSILTKDFLYDKYWVEGKSTVEIGKEVGCIYNAIGRYMKKFSIPRRGRSERIKGERNPNYRKINQLNENDLYNMYWVEGKSMAKIGQEIGCDAKTVLNYMKRFGIESRGGLGSNKGEKSHYYGKGKHSQLNKDDLYKMYWVDEKSMVEIGKDVGLSEATIRYYMKRFGIERRSGSEANRGEKNHNHGKIKYPQLNRDDLYKMYWVDEKNTIEIGKDVGLDDSTINYYMRKFGIKRRSTAEANSGENHYNWKGGVSFGHYCYKFNEVFKEKIRKRQGRKCFLCGKTGEENGQKLSVHHVYGDKMAGCNGNPLETVALCASCHSKVERNEKSNNELLTKLNNKNGTITTGDLRPFIYPFSHQQQKRLYIGSEVSVI